jgi:RNA-binding protein
MTPTPLQPLQGFQKRWLRARAQQLKPVVHVGESGVSDAVVAALDDALSAHELVKVRLQRPADKRQAADLLAERTGATLCGLVGHTVILYRPDPDEPGLELPRR